MNPDLPAEHTSVRFYDGDYPSTHGALFPENCDQVLEHQGLAHDLDRYLELAEELGGEILDLCCGTGRVTIPLARAGHRCTAVDVNVGMLARLAENLTREPAAVAPRITVVAADVTRLALVRHDYALAICAFNSLLCIPSFEGQRRALRCFANHLAPTGRLVLDVINPLRLAIDGDPVPKPFFTRRSPENGATYTRFAASDAMDAEHRQRLHGWYDELGADGTVRRSPYSLIWRPIFRFELELMLAEAGLQVVTLEGGHRREPYHSKSPRMFVVARRIEAPARRRWPQPTSEVRSQSDCL